MPVVPIAEGVTFPLPLEPDIEHIRQLQAPPPLQRHQLQSAGSSPVASTVHFSADRNCSGFPRDELSVVGTAFVENCTEWFQDPALAGPWWIQLFLGHDFVYYAFPVMLTVGLVCDLLGAAVMAAVICRSRSSSTAETVAKGYHINGGVATSGNGSSRQIAPSGRTTHRAGNVYLMWNMASGAILLTCGWTHRLADYYPTDSSTGDGSLWPTADEVTRRLSGGYIRAVDEWLSYASLWLLVTMDLDKALRLTSSGAGADDNSQSSSASTSSKLASSAYRKEAIICCSVYAVCLVSSLPHFFAFHTVETFDVTKNRTVVVSQPSNELTDSFEYRVVYYWYVVTLTVFIPLPLLMIISAVMVRTLVTRRRQRLRSKHKRQQQHSLHNHSNGHCTGTVSKSIISRKQSYTISSGSCSSTGGSAPDSSVAVDASSALSARLLLVTTALCLLFTSPRTLITCFEGLPSSRWWPAVTGRDSSEPTPASDVIDVVADIQSQSSTSSSSAAVAGELIRSLAEFSFYLYHASPFPLVCSYHDQLYRMLLKLFRYICCRCCCCCSERCQRRRSSKHSRHASNHHKGTGHSRPTAHGGVKKAVKKSVKFDSRTIEIEIQC